MRKFFALLALCFCLNAEAVAPRDFVTCEWDYSDPQPPDVFTLYIAPTSDAPADQWKIFMVIQGMDTMTGKPATRVTFNMLPGQYCFYITASNFWGESEPSNVACTPMVPPRPVLRIR